MPQMAPKFKLITLSGSKRNESFLFHLQVIKKQQKLENVSQETKGCVLSESFHLSLTDLFHFHSLISLGLDTKIYLDRFRKRMLKNNTFLLHLNVMPRVHPYAMSLE